VATASNDLIGQAWAFINVATGFGHTCATTLVDDRSNIANNSFPSNTTSDDHAFFSRTASASRGLNHGGSFAFTNGSNKTSLDDCGDHSSTTIATFRPGVGSASTPSVEASLTPHAASSDEAFDPDRHNPEVSSAFAWTITVVFLGAASTAVTLDNCASLAPAARAIGVRLSHCEDTSSDVTT